MSYKVFNGIADSMFESFLVVVCVVILALIGSIVKERMGKKCPARAPVPFGRRRALLLMGKLTLVCLVASWRAVPPANAQWTDFAAFGQRVQQMITQIMEFFNQIEQKLAAIQQLYTQIKQLEMLTRQLISLPKDLVRGAIGTVMQFYTLFKDIQGLGDEIKSLGSEFENIYPGYMGGGGSITGALQSVKAFSANLDNWMNKTREASKNVLKAAGIIEQSNQVDMDTAQRYVEEALYADGQMQVQQAQAGLAQVQIKQAAEAKLQMQALSNMIATETMKQQSKDEVRRAYLDEYWKGVGK